MIEIVNNDHDANKCDELLTRLIHDERINYDSSIEEKFVVKDYFINVIKNQNNILLCYKENDLIVGYLFLRHQFNENIIGYLIDGLFVCEEYRNRGIAKKLITKAMDILKDRKINNVYINVMFENIIARKLYSEMGFKEFKVCLKKEIDN